MVSNKTVDQMIALCPTTFTETDDVSKFLSECYRWAEIEDHQELKESAWVGLAKIDDITSRRQYRETCLNQLKAIKEITITDPAT